MTETSPHVRSVALFGALAKAPVAQHCQCPADVLAQIGRARATGYRALSEAEAAGLLQRDIQQSYRRGLVARRIGFSALGFGDLADVAEPLLTDLREAMRLTALIGVAQGRTFHVGPFSLGRGIEFLRPDPRYDMPMPETGDASVDWTLASLAAGAGPVHLRGLVLRRRQGSACVLALVSGRSLAHRAEAIDAALAPPGRRLSAEGNGR